MAAINPNMAYTGIVNPEEKPLFQFNGVELSTPPLGVSARREIGFLLGQLQSGETLSLPQARPLSQISAGLYELRVREAGKNWRIFYRVDDDFILVIHQFNKTTPKLPQQDIETIQKRLASYDAIQSGGEKTK